MKEKSGKRLGRKSDKTIQEIIIFCGVLYYCRDKNYCNLLMNCVIGGRLNLSPFFHLLSFIIKTKLIINSRFIGS